MPGSLPNAATGTLMEAQRRSRALVNEPGSQGQNKGKGRIKCYTQQRFDNNETSTFKKCYQNVIKINDIKLLKRSAETS